MYNKVILLGYLSKDVEIKYMQFGMVANSSIATNRKYKAQDGTQKEEVCFIDIAFFGKLADIAGQYLRKGSQVMIEGRLSFQQWQDRNTMQNRSKHSVYVESFKMLGSPQQNHQQYQQQYQQASYGSGANSYLGQNFNQPQNQMQQPNNAMTNKQTNQNPNQSQNKTQQQNSSVASSQASQNFSQPKNQPTNDPQPQDDYTGDDDFSDMDELPF